MAINKYNTMHQLVMQSDVIIYDGMCVKNRYGITSDVEFDIQDAFRANIIHSWGDIRKDVRLLILESCKYKVNCPNGHVILDETGTTLIRFKEGYSKLTQEVCDFLNNK